MQLYIYSSICLYGVNTDKFTFTLHLINGSGYIRTTHRLPGNHCHQGREARSARANAYKYLHKHVRLQTRITACRKSHTRITSSQSPPSLNVYFTPTFIYTLVFRSVFRINILYSLLTSSMRTIRSTNPTLTNSMQQSPP